jgi:hypothetical protein
LFGGALLVGEGSDLNGPAASDIKRRGSLENFEADFCRAGAVDVESLGGGEREIEDAAFNERAAIGNAQHCGMAGLYICYTYDGAEREREVRGGHGVHVVDFAIRAAAIVIRGTIPARHTGLLEDGLGAGGNFDLGIVDGLGGRSRVCRGWSGRLGRGFGRRRDFNLRLFVGASRQQKYA